MKEHALPIRLSDNPADDRLVNADAFALLVAMLLDQQVPIHWAFKGPQTLLDRMVQAGLLAIGADRLDAVAISSCDLEIFISLAQQKPAIHRYPKAMAKRIQALAHHIVAQHDSDAESLWRGKSNAETVYAHLLALPGFGEEKAKITLAVLAKRFSITPEGWEDITAPFSDQHSRSVADAGSPEQYEAVKTWKALQKKAGRDKAEESAS